MISCKQNAIIKILVEYVKNGTIWKHIGISMLEVVIDLFSITTSIGVPFISRNVPDNFI